jgi:hypothetical protein
MPVLMLVSQSIMRATFRIEGSIQRLERGAEAAQHCF